MAELENENDSKFYNCKFAFTWNHSWADLALKTTKLNFKFLFTEDKNNNDNRVMTIVLGTFMF